jgi:hypothetical protein
MEETAQEMKDRIQKRTDKAIKDSEICTYAEYMAIRRRIRIAKGKNRELMNAPLDQTTMGG